MRGPQSADSAPLGALSQPAESGEVGPLLRLSIPIIVTQLGQMLLGSIDAVIAGRLNVLALDAVALGNVWQIGTVMPMLGVVLGLDRW